MPTMVIGSGYMNARYTHSSEKATRIGKRLQKTGFVPRRILTFDPRSFENGYWQVVEVLAWEIGGRYLVGYEKNRPGIICIYRKRDRLQPAGGVTNPTYPILKTSMSKVSDYDDLDRQLGTIRC